VAVAHCGQIPLQDIQVDFQVEAIARPDARGFGVVTTSLPFVSGDAWPPAGFHVEMIPQGVGNREQTRSAAAAGTINPRRVVCKIMLHGATGVSPVQTIEEALHHDSLALSFRRGGVLLGEQIIVT
jgi:hypothetical protein